MIKEEFKLNTTNFGGIFNNNIKIVNDILDEAINFMASDIHIRDLNNKLVIEYRVLGEIVVKKIDEKINPLEIISRIKIMAKMDISQKRLPQDGAIRYKEYDIRVATLPGILGEYVVLRLLNTFLEDISLEYLGYSKEDANILKKAISNHHGLILITGPTGSGKSTTLLSLINMIDKKKRKVISIEDPVENKIEDIIQIQVREEIGLSFEKILRTVLRSDPDVIVISEIRDEISASIAIRAALTGHLVISTLHTNDTISSFSRLIDMKIPKYLLLDCLICISSQRLIKLDEYIKTDIKRRICINEIIYLSNEIKEIFEKNNDKNEILKLMKKRGYISIDEKMEELENGKNNSL